jgi:hypothetical protein
MEDAIKDLQNRLNAETDRNTLLAMDIANLKMEVDDLRMRLGLPAHYFPEDLKKNNEHKMNFIKVGQEVAPADGSRYRGVITYVNKERDTVRHKCLDTGNEYTKSYFGFFCRYKPADEVETDENNNL